MSTPTNVPPPINAPTAEKPSGGGTAPTPEGGGGGGSTPTAGSPGTGGGGGGQAPTESAPGSGAAPSRRMARKHLK